jgi:predicted AAA+ superfamily ATPase
MYIQRKSEQFLSELLVGFPVVVITGPRQAGKTTLARHMFPDRLYVSLEDPDMLAFATDDPRRFLSQGLPHQGLVIDEAQNCPHLFSYLQSHVDSTGQSGQFILTGSQQFNMLEKITQSLAGRVGLLRLLPFSMSELKSHTLLAPELDVLLLQGGYPPVYAREVRASVWYANYVQTYLERDVRQMVQVNDLGLFQKFLKLCAGRCGQLLNITALGNECGISQTTARSWISILEASDIIFLLKPHYANFNKRLVKTPKLYFYDTGLCAWLLEIKTPEHMKHHFMRGALFEALIVSEFIKQRYQQGEISQLYFWRDKTGHEVDLILDEAGVLRPIEIKSSETIASDFYKNLHFFNQLSGGKPQDALLVYGGSQIQYRHEIKSVGWRDLAEGFF